MARTAVRARRTVVIANSRGPESLAAVASEVGASAGTVGEAAGAGIVVIAVPWDRVPQAVQGIDWDGRTVIDATNDWAADDLNGRTSSEVVAQFVAGARVVKALNTLDLDTLGPGWIDLAADQDGGRDHRATGRSRGGYGQSPTAIRAATQAGR